MVIPNVFFCLFNKEKENLFLVCSMFFFFLKAVLGISHNIKSVHLRIGCSHTKTVHLYKQREFSLHGGHLNRDPKSCYIAQKSSFFSSFFLSQTGEIDTHTRENFNFLCVPNNTHTHTARNTERKKKRDALFER